LTASRAGVDDLGMTDAAVARVEVVRTPTPDLIEALRRLVPQLTRSAPPPDEGAMAALLADTAVTLLAARTPQGVVAGVAAVAIYRRLTGTSAHLEDVVVDEPARGAGIGTMLVTAAMDIARAGGADRLELTSAASRDAANRMYQRMGFPRRATNVYSMEL
jgi:ribosomal protein S18 acetylase RimI-like enzyme